MKLFFTTALVVASTFSFASANSVKPLESGCFDFTLSCGVTGEACGDDTAELLELIMIADDAICD